MAWVACGFAAMGCSGGEDGHPPVARIAITPRAIPEGDGFASDVVLDAAESADPLDDPEGAGPLGYRWQIDDDEARYQSGGGDDAVVTVRFEGRRPARIALTVRDGEGLSSTTVERMELTVR
jgi:hypothetical protein